MSQPLPSTSATSTRETGNTATAALVAVRGLHKVFQHGRSELHVLRGIDLTLERGEMVAVVGRSGAGKSTMLHILGALDRPTKGEIAIDGVALRGLAPARLAAFRNRNVGFVFQFHHLLPEFDALENVMMPCLIQRQPRRQALERALELLESVGLQDRLSHRPGELSGGEQQRVALARALAMGPKLLLADEPTGNLDSQTSGAMHELFFDLNERLGLTMMVVTHNTDLAARMPRQLRMRDGKIEDPGDGGTEGEARAMA